MSIIDSVIDKCLKMLAARIHANDQKVGDLSQLTIDEKNNIVSAINTLSAQIASRENLSVERVQQIAKLELDKITNGASSAMDTLAEVEAAFTNKDSQIAGLLLEIAAAKNKTEILEAQFSDYKSQVENKFNQLKEYVGYDERETLEADVLRLMNTGR